MAIFFCFSPSPLLAESPSVSLAEWTFPNNPDDALADTATPENSTEIIAAVGTSPATFATAGATTNAIRATGWQDGAETKYWTAKINTVGYKNILVSVKLRSSSTGPRDFGLQYRTENDSAWQDVIGGTILVADNFTTGSLVALPLSADAENQEALFLRLVMKTNQSVGGGTVSSTGANRLDDFLITAVLQDEPEAPPALGDECTGAPETIALTELLPYPALSDQEYAELFNQGEQCVNLSGWRLEDAGNHKYIFPVGAVIQPAEYLALVQNLFLNNTTSDTLTLYTAENEGVSSVTYGKALKGLSYSSNGSDWSFTSHLTPGLENIFDEVEEEEPVEAGSGIILNEIFPNPLSDESANEFIELKNISEGEVDLKGWSLVDASKKIFTFEEAAPIAPGEPLAVSRSTFGFSLNNTGTETIILLDPQGNTLSETAYEGSQEDFSYSFDGREWRWTSKVTPGKENEFSKTAKLSLTSKTEGYADIPLPFGLSIQNGKGPYRYSWDFGDGRRSTVKEPKHTYEKTGDYKGSVTVRAENGTAEKEFTVTIKKYPSYAVNIHALHPNPEGKDTDKEWLEITNLSKKKIDLTGWKIATGSDELTNHPLTPGLMMSPNQTLRLTRKHAALSLNNSAGAVELRYPNDKPASRTEYEEKSISENATCININGRCDFKDTPEADQEGADAEVKGAAAKEENTSAPNTPPAYPTKKEILARIGADFNLLMNQVLLDSWKAKPQ